MSNEVQVHFFAAARDLAGCAEQGVSLPAPSVSMAELRELLGTLYPGLAPHLPRMRIAINAELHVAIARVNAGDEVSVLPPVAGGSASPIACAIKEAALSVDEAIASVKHAAAGGIALFIGVVRDHAAQGSVSRLDYEAHEALALKEMTRILSELAREHPGTRIGVQHRVGQLEVGDLAVIVAVSAPHRAEAFAACREAIDRIKQSVPIWKKEWAPDGSALWVNLEAEPKAEGASEKKL